MKTLFTAAALLLCASAADAQQAPRWSITPVAGSYIPTSSVGSVSVGEGQSDVGLRTDASPLLGLSVERAAPGSRFALRTQFLFAPATGAVANRHVGEKSCGENCSQMLYERETLASGSTALGTLGVVFRPRESWRVRPYAVAGVGVRRYSVDEAKLETPFAEAFTEDRTSLIGHAGLGAAVKARRAELRVEVGDYFGRYRMGNPSPLRAHDLSTTVGLTIPLR